MLKKILLSLICGLLLVDAFMFHGHYRARMAREATIAEYNVKKQNWSTPLLDRRR